jgi:hypothetical protein
VFCVFGLEFFFSIIFRVNGVNFLNFSLCKEFFSQFHLLHDYGINKLIILVRNYE